MQICYKERGGIQLAKDVIWIFNIKTINIIYLDTERKLYWHDDMQNQGKGRVCEKG